MTTPEEHPSLDDALALARAAAGEMNAVLDEDPEPEPGDPVGWQPVWKRPRKPKSKAQKAAELHAQRLRLRDAGRRRIAASQSRRPRSRQNRIGNAAARRDARALARVRHTNHWLM
ncbi:hypothetical protein ABZ714_33950 [Streptomyces sp. NPDC006798]|uniref:hypothetical protein n=1 Tax=Streptomyces sp. NPDC006798 TaxID=3155462 RepID=UPI0033E24A15